jgi:hypothetical protein
VDDFERDVLELAQRIGADPAQVRQAALEALQERVAAAQAAGDPEAVELAAADAEHQRLASNYGGQPGMPSWNPASTYRDRTPAYAPVSLPDPRPPAEPTPGQEAEIMRLSNTYLEQPENLRVPSYGSAGGPTASELELAARSAPDYSRPPVYGSPEWVASLPANSALRAVWTGGTVPGTMALARQEQVTTATRAHSADSEDGEDPSDDLDDRLDEIVARHPGLGLRRRGKVRITDPTRGEHAAPGSQGSQSVRPKEPAQRARERSASRPGHT